jgi:hypothetical protein
MISKTKNLDWTYEALEDTKGSLEFALLAKQRFEKRDFEYKKSFSKKPA